jgi:hypothetical protein
MVEHPFAAATAVGAPVRVTRMRIDPMPWTVEQTLDFMIESTSMALIPCSLSAWIVLAWIRAFEPPSPQRDAQPPLRT